MLALYATGDQHLRKVADLHEPVAWERFQGSFAERLQREIAAAGCSKVYLSSEHLSSRVHQATQVQRIANLLQPLGDVKVICYVRPQHELFLSANSTFI